MELDRDPTTTVEDELALGIGIMVSIGMTPNAIAHSLISTGWTNPTLPYLAKMEAGRG